MERIGIAASALREAVTVIDRELGPGYAAAHPGILQRYMTISGMELRKQKGRRASANSVSAIKQQRIELVGRFMNSMTEPAPMEKIQGRVLYNAFVEWCHLNRLRPIAEMPFSLTLQSLGYSRHAGRIRYWLDLKLKDAPDM